MRVVWVASLAFLLLAVAIATTIFWLADPLNLRAPSDQKLISLFQDHRDSFETLHQMAVEDLPKGWNYMTDDVDYVKMSASRKAQYKHLLSEIGCIQMTSDKGQNFIFAGGGLLAIGPGWSKGIAYIPSGDEKEGLIRPNLDHMRKAPAEVYLRPIKQNWFLYYQRDDD